MSTVRSLGLHESSAIPFLVAEDLLPPDPSENLYSWTTSVDTGPDGPVENELVWTKSCVVWSRAGVIKRVFRLDLEKEDIKHALLTNFSVGKIKQTSDKSSSNTTTPKADSHPSQTGTQSTEGADPKRRDRGFGKDSSRALVAVLKSQAHIFFLEGNSHVVPLPFEVESVFATPRGLLFQRKVADESTTAHPMAPPNSFLSFSQDFRTSQSLEYPPGKTQRPSLSTIPTQSPGWKSRANKRADLPRVFSLMDPHSEMGLVVTNQASRLLQSSLSGRPSGFDVLDPTDEIIYVSPRDELSGAYRANAKNPLILVLTVNMTTGLYTLWTARYREDETNPSSKRKRRETGGTRSKRRSSHFGMTTGTTTPGARPPGPRESFGPRVENWNASVMSHSQFSTDAKPEDEEDDFASKLGQDFGDIGVPSKTSRRVSSMIARTDLATSQDRITFNDLATGSQSSSVHPGGLRQSIGAGSTRASFGFNPRASLPPAAGSIHSTASSFVDAPVDKLLEELNNDNLFEGVENMVLRESASGLPEEVLLSKVETFSSRFSGSFLTTSKLKPSKKLKVVTVCPTDNASAQKGDLTTMNLYVVDQEAKSMTVISIRAESVKIPAKDKVFSKRSKKSSTEERALLVQATRIRHFQGVLDVSKIIDGGLSRVITLSATDTGNILHLQTPWNDPIPINLPSKFLLHETDALVSIMAASLPREGGMKRVMTDSSITIVSLDHPAVDGKFDVVDSAKRRHKLQIRMEPTNVLVRKAFNVCRFALAGYFADNVAHALLVGWWDITKWLEERETSENDLEWTALVVALFSLAIPFIETEQTGNAARQTRRKRGLLRSSSGSYVDTESWESMLEQESGSAGVVAPWMNTSSWGWIVEQDAEDESTVTGHRRKPSKTDPPPSTRSTCRRNTYLIRCVALAREFLQTPPGIAAFGADGHLRTALSSSEHSPYTAICTILVALHLLREEQKLSACDDEQSHKSLGLLAPVLAQIGGWLGWPSWNGTDDSYYGQEIASINRWQFDDSRMTLGEVPGEPLAPPSIFAFLEKTWSGEPKTFWSLLNLVHSEEYPRRGKLWQWCYTLTPRTLSLDGFVDQMRDCTTVFERIELLHHWGLTRNVLETLPEGVSTPLYEAILQSQTHASTLWSPSLLGLIDRDDLSISMSHLNTSRPPPPSMPAITHDAMRDFHHIGNSALETDSINSFEASAEADRFSITKLIFRDDKRFIEAARLLNQTKAPSAECTPEPEWTDSDLLEAQKEVVQLVTLRTLSIPTGRAMLAFNGRLPLLTEKLPIPSFSLQCVMKPSNVTISADRASFSEEKLCWAFFHNGVSTGLAISKNSKGIDTSWILFNKPLELTNRHAGFLLALGLNGHLRSLAKWVAFKYLTPKHTMTSIGLLLGLSASYIGTMDTLITRLLSVHVTRMLPMGAAELNLSPLTQTAGIMGIGLLYCNSQHRRMSEVMLSEIENAEAEEGTATHDDLRDEGYRLAAGFSLGFINLGKGKDLKGMRDMHIVERLLAVAVGTKNVDLAHVLDRATAGATIALAIIFMKTNDETLAHKIDIPDTTVRFDYVRPDLFLLRTLARHVIMWDSIQPTDQWFIESLPESNDMPFFNIIAGLCFALGLRYSGSANLDVRDILLSYLDQLIRISRLPAGNYDGKLARNSVRHCQDVVALSLAAVMAGTGDLALFRRLRSLHGRVDPDTPYGSHMAAHMAVGLLFLGGGSYTLGTSDLAVASLICSLYPIYPTTVLDNKCHLQAFRHLWVLAAEPRCLVPRDLDSRRPVSIPISITSFDGEQRTLAAPCLLPDLSLISKVEVLSPDYWPLVLDFDSNSDIREKFKQGDQSIYLRRKATYNPTGTSVFASTLAGLSDAQDILPSSSTSASNQGKGLSPSAIPNITALLSNPSHKFTPKPSAQSIWDWIFQLQSLHGLLDARERELVLPSSFPTRPRPSPSPTPHDAPWLRQSAVDSKLLTESTVQNVIRASKGRGANPDEVRDRLWQLRLLFSWIDEGSFPGESAEEKRSRQKSASSLPLSGNGGGGGLWLKKDFIEELRWKIWGVQIGDHGGARGYPRAPRR
ncbi:negative regulator of mitosis [Aspergillus filifer]